MRFCGAAQTRDLALKVVGSMMSTKKDTQVVLEYIAPALKHKTPRARQGFLQLVMVALDKYAQPNTSKSCVVIPYCMHFPTNTRTNSVT